MMGLFKNPWRFVAVLGLLLALSSPARAAAAVPPQASQAVKQALLIFQNNLSSTNLDWWLKAKAMVALSGGLARIGNGEASRLMARNAIAEITAVHTGPAPLGFGAGPLYAELAQSFAELGDGKTAAGLINMANEELNREAKAAKDGRNSRAAVLPFLAKTAATLGQGEIARQMVEASHAAINDSLSPRELVSILVQLAIVETRIGMVGAAAMDRDRALALVAKLSNSSDRALAEAQVSRLLVEMKQLDLAPVHQAKAIEAYNQSTEESNRNSIMAQRSLATLAIAQGRGGDPQSARATLNALVETVSASKNPFEQFLGLLAIAEASIESGL
ncbi:MAG: hypothetical protein QM523_07965 [Candidatus Pacebacteria bacterium]|nr:hypothetical protein [Candidatus Paceibacterota bacterium]